MDIIHKNHTLLNFVASLQRLVKAWQVSNGVVRLGLPLKSFLWASHKPIESSLWASHKPFESLSSPESLWSKLKGCKCWKKALAPFLKTISLYTITINAMSKLKKTSLLRSSSTGLRLVKACYKPQLNKCIF